MPDNAISESGVLDRAPQDQDRAPATRTGWASRLAIFSMAALLFEAITGLLVTFGPFHASVEWGLIAHTIVGVLTLIPTCWYYAAHWTDYRRYAVSHVVLLGYVALAALLVCSVSGLLLTWQGLFATSSSSAWRTVHLVSTFAVLGGVLPHVIFVLVRVWRDEDARPARVATLCTLGWTAGGLVAVALVTVAYPGDRYVNEFPDDYSFLYGEDRPFAPSLALTSTGGPFDGRSLAGSESCGTDGCHAEILAEWQPSAHRYAAMDVFFQKIQSVMAQQNGPESTRYCGGCHDPISLFSGTKNIFADDLTGLQGYQEGVSCLGCHSIRETDLQGNANYVMDQPVGYLWWSSTEGTARVVRDFLIRTYPKQHNTLSKRMFKAPEYCAACHKQFIDQEVNRVGWVQLQNQYDNWAASHWNNPGEPERTVECRECHMPLVDSTDPASGDVSDYNRRADDGKHRSHRFLASNSMMPRMLEVEGWEQHADLTEQWLRGEYHIEEISDKWPTGPIVAVALDVPPAVGPGETADIKVVLTSNKVGHDYPTGPLDIIQSWIELQVVDDAGNVIFASGRRDERNFIELGSFLFKVEPVDQYGNLIDRHNLWEMVGVRFRQSLFPGYSKAVDFSVKCAGGVGAEDSAAPLPDEPEVHEFELPASGGTTQYHVTAILNYRKVDQFLLNFLLGDDTELTAPVVEIARASATIDVAPPSSDGERG